MKKLFLFSLVALLFIGCSTKKPNFDGKSTLICKKSDDSSETIVNETFIFAYDKNEKIHDFEFDIEYVYNSDISKRALDVAMKGFEIFAHNLGIYFKSIEKDRSLTFVFAGDAQYLEKVISEVIKSDSLKNFKDKKSDALNTFTKDGYECFEQEN